MARYTDIDNLIKIIQDQIIDTNPNDLGYKVLAQFIAALNHAPIADVVPREEVKRDLHDLLNYIRLNEDISKKCIEENGEENREYFKGKLSAFLQIRGFIDVELKKKYTETEGE